MYIVLYSSSHAEMCRAQEDLHHWRKAKKLLELVVLCECIRWSFGSTGSATAGLKRLGHFPGELINYNLYGHQLYLTVSPTQAVFHGPVDHEVGVNSTICILPAQSSSGQLHAIPNSASHNDSLIISYLFTSCISRPIPLTRNSEL